MCFSFIDIGLSFFIFSLIDQVEEFLLGLTRDVDEEYVWCCMDNGELIRIGLTDSGVFPRFRRNPKPYFYVGQYESSDEIISAGVLQ
jgi:hypothetical protein